MKKNFVTRFQYLLLGSILLSYSPLVAKEPIPIEKPDQVILITAERFTFTPSKIKVKKGSLVEIVLRSEDTDHGFRLESANIDKIIPPAGKGRLRIQFRAKRTGRYPFECSRPCGAGHNLMRGEIIVE
ncbi:MAG: cupredoxin domain-containing protein [Acidobacteriia bacterium]|jgi:cytochrome c oxidase subunit 2|nr:cupredoxin domain-containing protein [Terriglobia bacterium]